MNFNACTITGKRKLRKALYLPCDDERAGRGSILNFINRILGKRMHKTGSIEEIQKYTKPFEGCCCINFDELPTEKSNFRSISDNLKSLITEPTFMCRGMFSQGYQQKNTFNIYITSNNNSVLITQSNNARYVIANINTCYVGNKKYFIELNRILDKPEIQKLFYEDMLKRYEEKCKFWNEDDIRECEVKNQKLIESIPKCLKWLKEEYVLNNRGIDDTTTAFFSKYFNDTLDKSSKQHVNKQLRKEKLEMIPVIIIK